MFVKNGLLFIIFLLLWLSVTGYGKLFAQTFEEIQFDIPGFNRADAAFGDYDNDGDLDLCILGDTTYDGNSRSKTYIYRNDIDTLVKINTGIRNVAGGSCDWGDYDNDADLDLLITGQINDFQGITKIYRNDNGIFTDINANIKAFERGNAEWGDYDNDGDLDILACGASLPNGIYTFVYENVGFNIFNQKIFDLPGIYLGHCGWIDFDADMDLDIFLTGENQDGERISVLFENQNNGFAIVDSLIGLSDSFFDWGDFDNDADADLLLAGSDSYTYQYTTSLFTNDTSGFTDTANPFSNVAFGSANWGDFNNDNALDLFLNGSINRTDIITNLYLNNNGSFVKLDFTFEKISGSSAIGDIDSDGDLDIFITGSGLSKLYKNASSHDTLINENIPQNLISSVINNSVVLSWDSVSVDSGTFSYNVQVGTQPGLADILNPMADLETGTRRIAKIGNAGYNRGKRLINLTSGKYYWSVQSINSCFIGSAFSDTSEFTILFDPDNQAPFVINRIPDQALIMGRDIFVRNLIASPAIFEDPEMNSLYFSVDISDTSKAMASVDGITLQVVPKDTGEVTVTVAATDSHSAAIDTSFTVYIINLPEKAVFNEIPLDIPALIECSLAWGDYDLDGDLDFVISGCTDYGTGYTCDIYRNNDGIFEATNSGLLPVSYGVCEWGDYNNDGSPDLLISGRSEFGDTTILYKNDGGTFINSDQHFPGMLGCDADWGDYDNDGDLDLVLAGGAGGPEQTIIFRNDSLNFIRTEFELPGNEYGKVNWGDYDNDSDLDLLISGGNEWNRKAVIFINRDSTFVQSDDVFESVAFSSSNFGDYDNDGDLDIILSGTSETGPVTKIYNNNERYTDILAPLEQVTGNGVIWGDYDNDGDFDVLVNGYNEYDSSFVTVIYQNYKGCLIDIDNNFTGVDYGAVEWGDYDNDGDLDFLISGMNFITGPLIKIFRNESDQINTPPDPPQVLSAVRDGDDLFFTWNSGQDAQTETPALTYNIRIGITPGGQEIKSSMSNLETGYLIEPKIGNVNHNKHWRVKCIPEGNIYWSVQSVDNAFSGSVFCEEQVVISKIDRQKSLGALDFSLEQNYPNPFNPKTMISWQLPVNSHVNLSVYNILGQKVITLIDEKQKAGTHQVKWNANDFSSGIYFYRIQAEDFVQTKRMLLIK